MRLFCFLFFVIRSNFFIRLTRIFLYIEEKLKMKAAVEPFEFLSRVSGSRTIFENTRVSKRQMDTTTGIRIACAGMDRTLLFISAILRSLRFFLSLSFSLDRSFFLVSFRSHTHTHARHLIACSYKHTAAVILSGPARVVHNGISHSGVT